MKFYDAQQLRDWDAYTIKHEPISGNMLMKRAAEFCAMVMSVDMEKDCPVYVFCGTGKNGGDGLIIADSLKATHHVEVYVVNGTGSECPEFRHYLKKLKIHANQVNTTADLPEFEEGGYIIDAILGMGVNKPVIGILANIIEEINDSGCYIMSVDLPSGLQPEMHDHVEGSAIIKASETYPFQQVKPSMLLPETGKYCGNILMLPIGLHPDFANETPSDFYTFELEAMEGLLEPRQKFSHKGDYGHALLVVGSKGKFGAARFAAEACTKSGAGLLSVECGHLSDMMQLSVPEAMIFDEVIIPKITAVGCGCGLGTDELAKVRLKYVLENFDCPMVFDADALNLFAKHKDLKIPEGSILTPHVGEFERLFGPSANGYRRLLKAKEMASKLQVTIVLKGTYTITCVPEGEICINTNGNPGMAKGGSGDVLTGLITGFLAKGMPPNVAAIAGVYMHGLAGDLAVQTLDMETMTASDIINYFSDAFRFVINGPESLLPDDEFPGGNLPPGFSMN
ncbi:MAG: NAD(P)H-hydrate dehydratase [Flavobacteriaceae bacterium]|nr:NAD(P)H-hydrate dehydratase [Flavobacteriaceae bacterium]